jgi:toxin ParE1/3/4
MKSKPLVLREAARGDIEAAVDFYGAEAGEPVALRFVDALERAFRAIGRHPAAGSPRFGHELDLPGLRARTVRGFPFVAFYVEREDQADVWRMLHGQRDIPTWLGEPNA